MLRVTVEIVPFGIEDLKRTLKILEIFNMGPSNGKNLTKNGAPYFKYGARIDGKTYRNLIKKFDRELGSVDLIIRVVKALKRKGLNLK